MRWPLTRAADGFLFATAHRTRWRSSISKREPPRCGGSFPSDGFRARLCAIGPALALRCEHQGNGTRTPAQVQFGKTEFNSHRVLRRDQPGIRARQARNCRTIPRRALAATSLSAAPAGRVAARVQASRRARCRNGLGEPSVFKHVVYLIKENRTYDQVLGDVTARQRRPRVLHFRRANHAQSAQVHA